VWLVLHPVIRIPVFMRSFLIIGRSRKTGKDVLICGREVPPGEQIRAFKDIALERVNEDFSEVVMVDARPCKARLRPMTAEQVKAQAEAREKADAEAAKAKAKAEAKAKAKAEAKAKAKAKEGKDKKPE
jgi:hypothetical protein